MSGVSAYEIANKHRIGKFTEATPLLAAYHRLMQQARFRALDLTPEHALEAGCLAISHRDPFDRLLMAQALIEDLTLVTADRAIRASDVPTLW